MPILAILYTGEEGEGGSSSLSTHKTKEVGPQSTKGVHGDSFASEPGGIMQLAMWLCTSLLVGLQSGIQLCCVGSRQRRWGSSSYTRLSYTGPMDWFSQATLFKVFNVMYTTCERPNLDA
jgi:hypothetical protein